MWCTPKSNSFDRMARCLAAGPKTKQMRITTPLLFLASLVFISSCKKDEDEDPAPTPTPTATCGIAGMRLQGTIASTTFCADASLFADLAILLTSNGIAQDGATLTLELDSLSVGTYTTLTDVNHVLYTDGLGLPWSTTDAAPGTLTITSHNTATNRIQGSVSGELYAPTGGQHRTISASFDLTYTE